MLIEICSIRFLLFYPDCAFVSELLSWENVELLAELSHCPDPADPDLCEQSRHNKYRTITGVCNNR